MAIDSMCRGKHLDEQLLNDKHRSLDKPLQWHYTQAVLANVRGVGKPVFKFDFPSGENVVGEIIRGAEGPEDSRENGV